MNYRNRPPRFTRFSVVLLITLATLALFAGEAAAGLHRVGPINPTPSVGNFPAWYQDNTGITLEFCDPKNAAEVAGGWCLLLPGRRDRIPPPRCSPPTSSTSTSTYSAGADPVARDSRFLPEQGRVGPGPGSGVRHGPRQSRETRSHSPASGWT